MSYQHNMPQKQHAIYTALQILADTDYGRPLKPFFHRNQILGLGRQFGKINFGAFGVLSNDLSAPILVL